MGDIASNTRKEEIEKGKAKRKEGIGKGNRN